MSQTSIISEMQQHLCARWWPLLAVVLWGIGSLPARSQPTSSDTTQARAWLEAGEAALRKSDYSPAMEYFKKAAAVYEVGRFWAKHIRCRNRIATCLWRMGQLEPGEIEARKALDLCHTRLTPDHLEASEALLNLGVINAFGGEYDSAIYYFNACLTIREKILDPDHPALADVLNNLGVAHESTGRYEEALEYYFASLRIRQDRFDGAHPDLAVSYNNIGVIYDYMGDYDRALEYYEKSLHMHETLFGDDHPGTGFNCNNMAIVYRIQGDYQRAIEYFMRALTIQTSVFGETHFRVAETYQNLGEVYNDMEEYSKAMEYHAKSLGIRQQVVAEDHPQMADGFMNIGTVYLNMDSTDKAREYFSRALAINTQAYGAVHPRVAGAWRNIGITHLEDGAYTMADQHLQKALDIHKQIFPEKHPDIADIYMLMGKSLLLQDRFDKALQQLQLALIANIPGYSDTSVIDLPPTEGYLHASALLGTVHLKAQTFAQLARQHDNDASFYALQHFAVCDTLIRKIQKAYLNNEDKLTAAQKSADLYHDAIELCVALFRRHGDLRFFDKALYFAEANKMGVLRQQLADANARQFGGIPDSLLAVERRINMQRSYLRATVSKVEMDTAIALRHDVEALKSRLFALNRQYDSLIMAFEAEFPRYHALKYADTYFSVSDLQSRIAERHSALVEYSLHGTSLYVFVLAKDTAYVASTTLANTPDSLVAAFRATLDPMNLTGEPVRAHRYLVDVSDQLYRALVRPVLSQLPESIQRLIIVPHDVLAYIPFELLPAKPVAGHDIGYKDMPYLLRKYIISYAYSAYLWGQQADNSNSREADFAGFAPSYSGEYLASVRGLPDFDANPRSIGDLRHTKDEVEAAASYFGGIAYTGPDATENTFKDVAGKYRVLHLAMHAVADPAYPMESKLIFAPPADNLDDGILHAYELYNMQLHADLVVLSACNTGYGSYSKGEGVMSLSRAFTYAGCRNMVMSLWKTDDNSTAEIMKLFYAHMDRGLTIDHALQQARIDYLETADPLRAHPYFWAAFVANGRMGAERTTIDYKDVLLWTLLASSIMAGGIFWYRYRHQ